MIGERLKLLREQKGLSQMQVAHCLYYGASAIANYEAGKNERSISDLKKLATFFDVSVNYLVGENETLARYNELKYYTQYKYIENIYSSCEKCDIDIFESFISWLLTYDTQTKLCINKPNNQFIKNFRNKNSIE